MPHVTLRTLAGQNSDTDFTVTVQDATFEYLMTSPKPFIRVSTYLDRAWPLVEARYVELHVAGNCPFLSRITQVIPGSKLRTGIQLPGPMNEGEQLTVEVTRSAV